MEEEANLSRSKQSQLLEKATNRFKQYYNNDASWPWTYMEDNVVEEVSSNKTTGEITFRLAGGQKVVLTYSAPEDLQDIRPDNVSWIVVEPRGFGSYPAHFDFEDVMFEVDELCHETNYV